MHLIIYGSELGFLQRRDEIVRENPNNEMELLLQNGKKQTDNEGLYWNVHPCNE